MSRISTMPAYDICSHMGADATINEAEALRRIAIDTGWGEGSPSDVPDELWFHWVAQAGQPTSAA